MNSSKNPSEKKFEKYIEKFLNSNGYSSIDSNDYDKKNCIVKKDLISFIKNTQIDKWKQLEKIYGTETENKFIERLSTLISNKGAIETLRKQFDDRSIHFNLIYFKPNSSLNIDHQKLYSKNIFSVIRQFYYSSRNENSIDMCLLVNGIPIITLELKNQLTGQSISDSEKQYKEDRKPEGEPILKFKRMAAHFCVDNDNVSMTTKLDGLKTEFIPYNKDVENTIISDDYKSSYFWKEILTKDSILEIIENFAHVAEENDIYFDINQNKISTKVIEKLIFPRYHQLDLIRNLKKELKENGVGQNFLIYHATGSGKSYSIGWLSHMLTSLYKTETDTKRLFDTIVVVTDRTVIDEQLQNTINSTAKVDGVVNGVEKDSQELMEFLEAGKDIIITTIQKFPNISDKIRSLTDRKFAVIIDEVHSSQSGELSRALRRTLSKSNDKEDESNYNFEDYLKDEITSKGKQKHISFFGFTGTPKQRTLEMFGTEKADGKFYPFHTYSMRQSILEGFTLDVLQNYTTFNRYFKIKQTKNEELIVPVRQGVSDIIKYVDNHTLTIQNKINIILDHFISKASKEIQNKSRGMIVVKTRELCIKYFKAINKQLDLKGVDYKCLVAFTGESSEIKGGEKYSEKKLNSSIGYGGSVRFGLKNPKYRLLVVANKFQTGFDEPLIQSMYIDKKIQEVQCVQTLSRLNRTMHGKTQTFVLDFVNTPESVQKSFQDYYEDVSLEEETDPNKLYDLKDAIYDYKFYTNEEVQEFCKIFFDPNRNEGLLQPSLNKAAKRWKDHHKESEREEFRLKLFSYIRLYSYLSQVIDFVDEELEKSYLFYKYLSKKLTKKRTERINFFDSINLEALRIQEIHRKIKPLKSQEKTFEKIKIEEGSYNEASKDLLSNIVSEINDLYGIFFTEDDKQNLNNMKKDIFENREINKYMKGFSSDQNKYDFFTKKCNEIRVNSIKSGFDFFKKLDENQLVKNKIYETFYKEYNDNLLNK